VVGETKDKAANIEDHQWNPFTSWLLQCITLQPDPYCPPLINKHSLKFVPYICFTNTKWRDASEVVLYFDRKDKQDMWVSNTSPKFMKQSS